MMDYREVMWIILGLWTLLHGSLAGPTFTTTPENTAILASTSVSLSCQITQDTMLTDYISWEECITPGGGTCKRISNDLSIVYATLGGDATREARYSVASTTMGRYDLTITGAIMGEDAGVYRCLSRNAANVFADARVIILQSNPTCSSNLTNYGTDKRPYVPVEAECSVIFKGQLVPVTTIQVRNQDRTVVREEIGRNETTEGKAKYTFVYKPLKGDEGKHFWSRTFFNQPISTDNMAGNAPSYESLTDYGQLSLAPTVRCSVLTAFFACIIHSLATRI